MRAIHRSVIAAHTRLDKIKFVALTIPVDRRSISLSKRGNESVNVTDEIVFVGVPGNDNTTPRAPVDGRPVANLTFDGVPFLIRQEHVETAIRRVPSPDHRVVVKRPAAVGSAYRCSDGSVPSRPRG